MKKFSNFLLTISAFILSMVMVGCGNSNKNLFMSKAERYKTTLVPVFRVHWKYGNWIDGWKHFAICSSSGEFEKFNNDADYEEYSTALYMACCCFWLRDVDNGRFDELQRKFKNKYGEKWDEKKWTSEESDQYVKLKSERMTSLIQGVAEYLYGDKNNISDENLYKVLDEYYYNHHPDEWQTQLEDSYYGFKSYFIGPKDGVKSIYSAHSPKDEYFYFSNNQLLPIPEGSLILTF